MSAATTEAVMYKYTFSKGLRERAKYYPGCDRKYPSWDWTTGNVKPRVDDWTYQHYGAVKHLDTFTYYSKTPLDKVPMNGYLFPVCLFDCEEIEAAA